MIIWNKICALSSILLLTSSLSIAQAFKNNFPLFHSSIGEPIYANKIHLTNNIITNITYSGSSVKVNSIPGDYYTRNFGYFCKKELQFEKATRVPLRFRLGSLQQCDQLERKIR